MVPGLLLYWVAMFGFLKSRMLKRMDTQFECIMGTCLVNLKFWWNYNCLESIFYVPYGYLRIRQHDFGLWQLKLKVFCSLLFVLFNFSNFKLEICEDFLTLWHFNCFKPFICLRLRWDFFQKDQLPVIKCIDTVILNIVLLEMKKCRKVFKKFYV